MLKTLRRIIQEVANAQDFKEALDIMVKRVAKALHSQACSVFLLDRRTSEYVLAATKGLNPQAVWKIRIPLNQGLIGLVGEREEPVNLDEASKHPRFLHIDEIKEEAYRAFLGVPIIYHRQVLGVIMVQQYEAVRYDESEEALLVTLAAQLSSIIAHAEATGAIDKLLDSSQTVENGEATYSGIPSSPGVGIGRGAVVYPMLDLDVIPDREPENIEDEVRLLKAALALGQEDFRILASRLYPNLPPEERILFDVYQRILDSADLGAELFVPLKRETGRKVHYDKLFKNTYKH